MRITECRFVVPADRYGRVVAYVQIVFRGEMGSFMVNRAKLIRLDGGKVHLQFPSRKVEFDCPNCRWSNPFSAQYCMECGFRVNPGEFARSASGDEVKHLDCFFPLDRSTRDRVTRDVVSKFVAKFGEIEV